MNDKLDEYMENGGWSSALFATQAVPLILKLKSADVPITVGRSVIHIGKKLKAYVHHNGRTHEYATITDWRGQELKSFHYTEFQALEQFILQEVGVSQ